MGGEGGIKTQVKLRKNKLLKYLVQNLHFVNKEKLVVVVGVTWGYICACMCVYVCVQRGQLG